MVPDDDDDDHHYNFFMNSYLCDSLQWTHILTSPSPIFLQGVDYNPSLYLLVLD